MQRVFIKMLAAGKHICADHHFDVLLASASNTSGVLDVANRLSMIRRVPWVADLRDIFEQAPIQGDRWSMRGVLRKLWRDVQIRRRNKLLHNAAASISVSPQLRNILLRANPNTHLIYNGYDEDVFKAENPHVSARFELLTGGSVYQGEAYPGPRMLFGAIARLHQAKEINTKQFVVSLFVSNGNKEYLLRIAREHGIEHYLRFHEQTTTGQYATLMQRASILVLFTSAAASGVMGTKYFECLGVARPVLLLPGDEGCLESSMAAAKAGCSAHNTEEACAFVREKYHEWTVAGTVRSTTDLKYASQFRRSAQARQFSDLLSRAIELSRERAEAYPARCRE